MFANKRDELSGFGQRLFDLMNAAGYPVAHNLAIALLNQGLVTVKTRSNDPTKSWERAVNCVERKIITHLNSTDSSCLQGEFAKAYHEFFGIPLDYLYGYTDVKTSNTDFRMFCQNTGLSEKAVSNLIRGNSYRKEAYPINTMFSRLLEIDDYTELIEEWGELNDQIYNIAQLNVELQRARKLCVREKSGKPMYEVGAQSIEQLEREKSRADRINRGFISDFSELIKSHMMAWINDGISRAEEDIRNKESQQAQNIVNNGNMAMNNAIQGQSQGQWQTPAANAPYYNNQPYVPQQQPVQPVPNGNYYPTQNPQY